MPRSSNQGGVAFEDLAVVINTRATRAAKAKRQINELRETFPGRVKLLHDPNAHKWVPPDLIMAHAELGEHDVLLSPARLQLDGEHTGTMPEGTMVKIGVHPESFQAITTKAHQASGTMNV